MRRACVALLLLVGCRRAPVEDPTPLLVRYPIRPHVRWTERRDRGGAVTTHRRAERWTVASDGAWDVVTTDVDSGTPFYRARYALTAQGLAQTAVLDGERIVPVEPPRLALPANTSEGHSWEQAHRVGAQRSQRACRMHAHPGCRDGVEQRCTTTYPDGRVVEVRNRYCGGVGMVGYTSTTRRVGSDLVVRIWSEDLVDVVDAGP